MNVRYLIIAIVFSLLVSIAGFLTFTPNAFAEITKSVVTINGTQYEIEYKPMHLSVDRVSITNNGYLFNSMKLLITSDRMQTASLAITMPRQAMENIFCLTDNDIAALPDYLDFGVLVDEKEQKIKVLRNDNNITFTFDIPAGSRIVKILHQYVGMAVEPQVSFKEIPEFVILRQGEQVSFKGIFQDACGRILGNGKVQFMIQNSTISAQTTADENGNFVINFTLPQDMESGRYKAVFNGAKDNLNGARYVDLLIHREGELNLPVMFKHPDLETIQILYHFKNGEIIDIGADLSGNSIDIRYFTNENGTLEIEFPKRLMDFVGRVNQTYDANDLLHLPYPEKLDSNNHRIFEIPVLKGIHVFILEGIRYGAHPGTDQEGIYPVRIGDRMYPIPYNITRGALNSITADIATKTLKVEAYSPTSIVGPGGGHIRITLPRNVIDSVKDGKDKGYLVTIYSSLHPTKRTISFVETQTSSEGRTLEINFMEARSYIEITGTQVVPEFPVNFVAMTAIALMGALVALRLTSNRQSLIK